MVSGLWLCKHHVDLESSQKLSLLVTDAYLHLAGLSSTFSQVDQLPVHQLEGEIIETNT